MDAHAPLAYDQDPVPCQDASETEEVGHVGQVLHPQDILEEAELHILAREDLVLEEIRAEASVDLGIQALGLREEGGYWRVEG